MFVKFEIKIGRYNKYIFLIQNFHLKFFLLLTDWTNA